MSGRSRTSLSVLAVVLSGAVLGGCAAEDGLAAGPATATPTTPATVPAPATTTVTTTAAVTPDPPPCDHRAVACVQLSTRQAWLTGHGHRYGPVPISYGVGSNATPVGTFHVVWKAAHWHSHEYGDPMPHSVFFAAGGIAFHEGSLTESSHGCVHLSKAAAAQFFDALNHGDEVQILR